MLFACNLTVPSQMFRELAIPLLVFPVLISVNTSSSLVLNLTSMHAFPRVRVLPIQCNQMTSQIVIFQFRICSCCLFSKQIKKKKPQHGFHCLTCRVYS